MKKLIAIFLVALALLSLCACQKTCKYDGCELEPLEDGEYCEKHTCHYPGCMEYGIMWWYEEGHYCQSHWNQIDKTARESENPEQVLDISCGIAADGIAYWDIENNGVCTYRRIEIELVYINKYGKEKFSRSEFIYGLKPGDKDGSANVLMFCETTGTLTARIVDYEKAD